MTGAQVTTMQFDHLALGQRVLFGASTAIDGLQNLRAELDAPRALKDFGLPAEEVPRAAKLILPTIPPSNPRTVTVGDLEQLLNDAYAGAEPSR